MGSVPVLSVVSYVTVSCHLTEVSGYLYTVSFHSYFALRHESILNVDFHSYSSDFVCPNYASYFLLKIKPIKIIELFYSSIGTYWSNYGSLV